MPATPSIEPGFHAIHANHLEDLRRAVVWICRQSPLPPLESETFLVQSNGIAQWLKLALAEDPSEDGADVGVGGLGIAAGMDFLFPARFIWQAYRAVLRPAVTSSPAKLRTCSISTRFFAPIGWPTGRLATTACGWPVENTASWAMSCVGRPCCGAGWWLMLVNSRVPAVHASTPGSWSKGRH